MYLIYPSVGLRGTHKFSCSPFCLSIILSTSISPLCISPYSHFLNCPSQTSDSIPLPFRVAPSTPPPLSHSLTTSFVKMKTKSSLPKYFYSCSLTKQRVETMQKDVQAYLSRQRKDGKFSPHGLFAVIGIHCRPPHSLLHRSKPVFLKYSSDTAPRIKAQLYICVRPSLCQAVHPPVAPGDPEKPMATVMCLFRPLAPLDNITHQALTLVPDHFKWRAMGNVFLACKDFQSLKIKRQLTT